MKGAPLHYGTKAHKAAGTKMLGDLNKNGKMEGWEKARQEKIEANSPANYGSPVKEAKAKMASAVLPEVKVTAKKKKETGRKKLKNTSLANRNKGLTGYEITYSDGTKKKVLTK
jgi:hypothetical protein